MTYKEWIDSKTENFPYYNPAPKDEMGNDQFPIIAAGLIYENGTNPLPLKNLEVLSFAGFNVCMQGAIGYQKGVTETLKNAISTNTKIILNNGYFRQNPVNDWVSGLYEGLGGISLKDEPTYYEMIDDVPKIDENGKEIETLQQRYRYLMEQKLPCIVYINLVGGPEEIFMPENVDNEDEEESTNESKEAKYIKYIETFQEFYKPAYFSYDLYPISEYSPLLYAGILSPISKQEGEMSVDYNRFYRDLEIFASLSMAHRRPFWAFCQSQSYMSGKSHKFKPMAKEEYLRFEAFSALAYGAQGIIYWAYPTRQTNRQEDKEGKEIMIETYFTALLDRKGRKTASWYYAQKINFEIHRYKDCFLDAEVMSRNEIKDSEIFSYKDARCSLDINISKVSANGILISRILAKIGMVLVVMSRDVLNYQEITIKVNINDIMELTPETSTSEGHKLLSMGEYKRILIPGGYRIFKLW